jgi:hypothetical protein
MLDTWADVVEPRLYRIKPMGGGGGWDIAVMSRAPRHPSVIHVRPLGNLDRIKGLELVWFGVSQLDDRGITRALWDWLTSRLSHTLPAGFGTRVERPSGAVAWEPDYTGFGEANSGTKWIIDLWGPMRTHRQEGYKAIEVSLYDNAGNLPADTVRDLEQKPEYWKKWFVFPCWEPLSELEGTPVFQGHFDFRLHVAGHRVTPEPGWPIIRGWDAPGPVGTVWFQIDRDGRCRVLYEQLADIGASLVDIKRSALLISEQLFPGFEFLDISDPPAVNTKSPTDQKTVADILRPEIALLPGEPTLAGRLEAGRQWLDRAVPARRLDNPRGGPKELLPAVVIDPGCRLLHGGLANSYVWKQVAGRDLPEPRKNEVSHIVDAWLHALARVSHIGPRSQANLMGPRNFGPPD